VTVAENEKVIERKTETILEHDLKRSTVVIDYYIISSVESLTCGTRKKKEE
jgi:hypothetical protein